MKQLNFKSASVRRFCTECSSRKRTALLLSILLLLPVPILFTACCNKQSELDFSSFLDELFQTEVTASTLNLHYTLKNPSDYGITDYPVTLGHFSSDKNSKELEKTLKKLSSFSQDTLTQKQQFIYDLLMNYLSIQKKLSTYHLYEEPLIPSNGIQAQLPVLFAEYSFSNEQDIHDYLELLSKTDHYFSEIMDFEKEKAAAGLFMSDEDCNHIITECEEFIKTPDDNYLIETFEHRLSNIKGLSREQIHHYETQNKQIISDSIIPAYQKLIDGLSALLGSGTNNWGLCYDPDGKAYYELLVTADTGDADSIPEIAEKIKKHRDNDILTCAELIRQNPDLLSTTSATELTSAKPEQILESLKQSMLSNFPKPPDASYSIHYVDPCLQDYLAPAFYITSPIDDYSNNSIYINNSKKNTSISNFTTLAHEGYPGHLYQTIMSYSYGMEPIQSILNYPGYVEGWATYVEMLSYAYTGLPADSAAFLMHNQSATLSLYATADIGIHYEGWTKPQINQFWKTYGITDHDAIDEITGLIVSDPGNYLKYYVGYINFLDLHEKVKSSLKTGCSLKDFHKTVLAMGPAPFSLLASYFADFYESVP